MALGVSTVILRFIYQGTLDRSEAMTRASPPTAEQAVHFQAAR